MRLTCNFINVNMIAYRVHVYMRASLIHSPNPNPDSPNRISPKYTSGPVSDHRQYRQMVKLGPAGMWACSLGLVGLGLGIRLG